MRKLAVLVAFVTISASAASPALAQHELEPEAAKHHRKQGEKRMMSGDFRGAISSFNQALQLDPNNHGVFFNRGRCKHFLHDLNGAITDYSKSIWLIAGYHQAWHARAIAYAAQGKWKLALKDLNEAIRLRPNFAEAFNSRATVLGRLGEDEEAIADCTEAIRLRQTKGKEYPEALHNRANAFFRLNRLKSAKDDLSTAVELEPWRAQYHLVLADALARLGETKEAIAAYTQAIQIGRELEAPKGKRAVKLSPFLLARATSARGRTRWLDGDKKRGLADIVKAADMSPDFAYTPLWVFALSGDARRLQHVAQGKEWIHEVVRFYLGRISGKELLARANEPKTEKEKKERLCEAYCYMALLEERRGKAAKARALYKKSLDTGVTRYTEYFWAKVRLQALGKKGT